MNIKLILPATLVVAAQGLPAAAHPLVLAESESGLSTRATIKLVVFGVFLVVAIVGAIVKKVSRGSKQQHVPPGYTQGQAYPPGQQPGAGPYQGAHPTTPPHPPAPQPSARPAVPAPQKRPPGPPQA